MTEEVRMDSLRIESCLRGDAAEDQEGPCAGQATAPRVEEELRPVARVEVRAPACQVSAYGLDGLPTDRDDPLLGPFPDAADKPALEVDARLLQADGLADPQARAVEELDERLVAQRAWARASRSLDEPFSFRRREGARECLTPSR